MMKRSSRCWKGNYELRQVLTREEKLLLTLAVLSTSLPHLSQSLIVNYFLLKARIFKTKVQTDKEITC